MKYRAIIARAAAAAAACAVVSSAAAAACSIDAAADGPWFPSVVPFEHFDSGRSHRFRCAPFTGDFDGANALAAKRFAADYRTPYILVMGEEGAHFVYGGAYGEVPGATGSFVARIDDAGQEVWRRRLFDAAAAPERWNYPGAVGVHRNGFVYAAFADKFVKLDPQSGAVLAETSLPTTASPENVAYDGFNAFADGRFVLKSVNRAEGCALQGFSAFLRCEGARDVANSMLAVVDPETMQIVAALEAPEHIGGRLTTARLDGVDRLYLVGARRLYRYDWDGASLSLDGDWGPVLYALPGQSPAPAAAILGDWVVLQTNAIPAKTPMSVVAVNQRDGRLVRLNPFENVPPWEYTFGSKSFLPSMLSVDPENSRVYIADGGYGLVAGYALNQKTGKLRKLWMEKQRTLNFSTLVGSKEERVWVGTDVRGLCLFMKCLKTHKTEEVVLRNAETGAVLGRSEPLPKMTTGALVTPGGDGELYYLGLAGDIYKVTTTAKE